MDGRTLNHVEKLYGLGILPLQVSVCCEDVKPLGIEQVNLMRVFPQRRKAGRIPGNVERGADTFSRVELHLGWRLLRPAMTTAELRAAHPLPFLFFLVFFQRMIRPNLIPPRQFGELFVAEGTIHEEDDEQ